MTQEFEDAIAQIPQALDDMRREQLEVCEVRLRGAVKRFLMLLEHGAGHGYEVAFNTVECAMVDYREARKRHYDACQTLQFRDGSSG